MKKYILDNFIANDEEAVKQENIFKCTEEHVKVHIFK